MNVNKVITAVYKNIANWTLGENEPKTNPNEANFQKAAIFVTTFLTKEYENKSNWAVCENKANTKPIKANFSAPRGETNPKQTQINQISKAKKMLMRLTINGRWMFTK